MVTRLLRLDAPPKPADAADALALAICHIWRAAQPPSRPRAAAAGRRLPTDTLERPYRMIAFVCGPVAALAPTTAVIEVGGVGMAVQCTPAPSPACGSARQAKLATSLVVREDSLTLYGFADDDERQVFELLQTASGVGPRLAQAMLAVHSPDALRVAVATGDEKALTAVPGIGKKGAQKLLLELKDRLGEPVGAHRRAAVGAAVTAPGATSCTPP